MWRIEREKEIQTRVRDLQVHRAQVKQPVARACYCAVGMSNWFKTVLRPFLTNKRNKMIKFFFETNKKYHFCLSSLPKLSSANELHFFANDLQGYNSSNSRYLFMMNFNVTRRNSLLIVYKCGSKQIIPAQSLQTSLINHRVLLRYRRLSQVRCQIKMKCNDQSFGTICTRDCQAVGRGEQTSV